MSIPTARASMLIRCPIATVFDAFVNPAIVTQFWLERTSGPLAPNARVTWWFMVPGATETVSVTAFEDESHLVFDWSDGKSVTIEFTAVDSGTTTVGVAVTGFDGGSVEDDVVNATEGFSIVLCDLKTLLEGGRSAHLVRDKAALIADIKR